MIITETNIPDVLLLEPIIHGDDRGFFMETFRRSHFEERGIALDFVQDNQSRSKRGTLRGLHFQIENPQGKLVRVLSGEVFDVAVDLRQSSPTFGEWVGERLSSDNNRQMWVPPDLHTGSMSSRSQLICPTNVRTTTVQKMNTVCCGAIRA